MAKLISDMSMSLDGFVAGEGGGVTEVFAWLSTERNEELIEESVSEIGAILTGRRTSDGANAWGGSTRSGSRPTSSRTGRAPDHLDPTTSMAHFVDDLEEAVRLAKEAAGEKAVGVAGGDTVRQLLALGLLDEIRVSLAPVLLGNGVPYFPDLERAPVELEGPEVREGDGVTRLHYRVKR